MNYFLLLLLAGLEHEYWAGVRHYQYIEAWDKYCDRSHQLGDMVMHARRQVFNQDKALNNLELALNNFTYQAIALVGPSRVGKSLTAKVLEENFPWPEQVKTMSWRNSTRKSRIISMIKNASQCGQTLILIDDMTPEDIHFVPLINKLIFERKEIANGPEQPLLKQLTIIYVITVKSQQQNQDYETEMQQLSELERTHVVNFDAI